MRKIAPLLCWPTGERPREVPVPQFASKRSVPFPWPTAYGKYFVSAVCCCVRESKSGASFHLHSANVTSSRTQIKLAYIARVVVLDRKLLTIFCPKLEAVSLDSHGIYPVREKNSREGCSRPLGSCRVYGTSARRQQITYTVCSYVQAFCTLRASQCSCGSMRSAHEHFHDASLVVICCVIEKRVPHVERTKFTSGSPPSSDWKGCL